MLSKFNLELKQIIKSEQDHHITQFVLEMSTTSLGEHPRLHSPVISKTIRLVNGKVKAHEGFSSPGVAVFL